MTRTYFFKPWFYHRLKKQQNSPIKLKNEAELLRSEAVTFINQQIEPLWLKLMICIFKIGIKDIQKLKNHTWRDDFLPQETLTHPLFSQNEISKLKTKFWLYVIVLFIGLVAESFLFFLTSALVLPGATFYMKISVSIFMVILTTIAIDYAMTNHFTYKKVRAHNISQQGSVGIIDKRNLGYLIGILAILFILFSGVARSAFLESAPASGLPQERLKSIAKANKITAFATICLTLLTSLVLGIIKHEYSKISEKYHVYKHWLKSVIRRNAYCKEAIKICNKIYSITEQSIEKQFQIMLEIRRVFKVDIEFDKKFEALDQEYADMKSKPSFTINEQVLRKFLPLIPAYFELFRFSIISSEELKKRLAYNPVILKSIEDYLIKHSTIEPVPT